MPFGRKSLLSAALLAATTVPYAVTTSIGPKRPAGDAGTGLQPQAATPEPVAPVQTANVAVPAAPEANARLAGPPVRDFREIFRFDVTPQWIMQRWSRVLTQTSEADVRGYRVPLVTGHTAHDLAGSLTYYFGPEQQVEKIVFRGTTGDPRPLTALVARQYGMERKQTDDPGLILYQRSSSRKIVDELDVRVNPVVRSYAPNARYTVALMLERPSSFRTLSQSRRAYSDRLGPEW